MLASLENFGTMSDLHHLSISRPHQSRSEQVCLVSSDLLHMHLPLAGMHSYCCDEIPMTITAAERMVSCR